MTVRRTFLLVALVVMAGCTWSAPQDTPTPEVGPPTESPSETPTPTADDPRTTDTPTTSPAVTPPEETPAAAFVVDDERRAAVTLEVADTDDERRRGLMHRESLERNHGMLFVFASEAPRSFWMKNTLIPLDMIFVDANRTVVNVEHAAVQPNASDDELRDYRSDGPAKYVIEVNRGFTNRTGIESGTEVDFHGNETLLTPES